MKQFSSRRAILDAKREQYRGRNGEEVGDQCTPSMSPCSDVDETDETPPSFADTKNGPVQAGPSIVARERKVQPRAAIAELSRFVYGRLRAAARD